ncbi:MAG: type II secretion system protein [Candidatus Spechtbacteria bacterium SB0662_bin_43]|uniref:Type II secretion system protein n=1 Tax=Candidatus Spechtbacteria bacterium SB0662_bin_43 TaxID=2604897 RepID=A0A845DA53_9BACT|nr:type II secretion system protein [Candidatus Spechtbacteria bacterium SB0662_bin_43]
MGTVSIIRNYIIRQEEGFTLFEVLLVIAIIGTLSTIAFLSFNQSDSVLELQRVRFSIEQGLENAKSNAFNGLLHHGDHVGSFGVHIEKGQDSIVIFADCNDDREYNGIQTVCNRNTETEWVDTIAFEGDFSITQVVPCSTSGCVLSIIFQAPFATTGFYVDGSAESDLSAEMTISNGGTLTETITVNRAGRSTKKV